MRVYRGYPQRGAGLGNILGALFRVAKPILRSMLPVAARYGSRILGDVAEGENVLRSARKHAPRAGVEALKTVVVGGRGGGRKRKQRGSGLRTASSSKRRKTNRTVESSHIKAAVVGQTTSQKRRRRRRRSRTKLDVFDQTT